MMGESSQPLADSVIVGGELLKPQGISEKRKDFSYFRYILSDGYLLSDT